MYRTQLITVAFVILGIVCFFAARIFYVDFQSSQTVFKPQAVHMQLQPPNNALSALVTNIFGDVNKQGRSDTDFKPIHAPTTLIEGESLNTGNTGSATVSFPQTITLSLEDNTQLDYLNGLPTALVVRQPNGTIAYTTSTEIKPFSIRSLGLLTQIADKATVIITTDATEQTVLVRVLSGTATLAYSDANNNTQVQKLAKGHQGFFDYTASTLKVR